VVRPPAGTPGQIDWKNFLRLAAPLAGLVAITAILFPPTFLVLFPGSVFLAVHLYRRRQPGPLKTAQGVKMGAMIGLLTFAILTVYRVGQVAQDPGSFHQTIDNALRKAVARNPDPEAARVVHSLSTTTGLAILAVIAMGLVLGFMLVVGGVSGALAASLSRNRPGP
jgi:hypothetical protein